MKFSAHTPRSLATLALGALALTSALTGCSSEASHTPETPAETVAPTQPAPEPTEAPVSWERFTDDRFSDSFELPPGWSVQEHPSSYDDQGLFQFDLIDTEGVPQLFFSTMVQGLGGACSTDAETLKIVELDSTPLELDGYLAPETRAGQELVAPRFVYRASQLEDRVITSIAISNDVPSESCMYYNLLSVDSRTVLFADRLQVDTYVPSPMPSREFATMDEARTYIDTEEFTTIKRILLSYQLQ